jgi:hypothetical protein
MGLFTKKETIKSEEYHELKSDIGNLSIKLKTIELELQLYVKKLKASKGIKDLSEKEDEENINKVIIPEK